MEDIAIIIYGNGGDLGSFKVFADDLFIELSKNHTKVILKYLSRDYDFFNLLDSIPNTESIKELHFFAHSIGAGLFLGYKDHVLVNMREDAWKKAFKAKRNVTYEEVVSVEVGAIQTDDLVSGVYAARKAKYQKLFAKDAFIKIWGCNSGVDNWVYSDGGVVDQNDTRIAYYWRALNEKNVPKPSIAKAMAKYFNVKVYGAKSGASIQVNNKGTWISTQKYKDKIGHWPSGTLPHRLVPDKGTYYEFNP
jgi:hypothetical protein